MYKPQVVFEDLYWMHKVSIILAIVVVDSVVISEFVTSVPLRGTLDQKLRILAAGKKFLHFITSFYDLGISRPPNFSGKISS